MLTRSGFICALIAGSLPACSGIPADWVALERTLNSPAAVSMPFEAEYGGYHQVVLEFAWPISDIQVEGIVTSAAATTGASEAPTFDFSWQLEKQGQVVARREGPQRSTGARETRTSGLGQGPLKSMGLVFAGFELEAGNAYTFRVLSGSDFSAIIQTGPRVVVVRQPFTLSSTP